MRIIIILLITSLHSIFAQSVVINKFYNSGLSGGMDDAIELLIIEKNLNMQGMILKDFSSSMNGDNGGKYIFKENPLWSHLPAGTLIIIRITNQSFDIDTSDFVIDVGLKDTTYFQQIGSTTFDIASTELVMIKEAGSEATGVSGSIHAFGSGTAGSFFNQAPSPKLRSSGTSGGGKFAFAKNSTSTLNDFDGNDADTSSNLILGQPNNETNALFINRLRSGETKVELSTNTYLKNFELYDNYPNPFNPTTTISFKLHKDSNIELSVYNLIGKKVSTLLNGFYKSGTYSVKFDGTNLSSGVYIYKLTTNFGSISKKMIFIK